MMAKHSYEKARWNRRETRKRTRWNGWGYGCLFWGIKEKRPLTRADISYGQRWLDRTVHRRMSECTRRYRRLWRRRGHQQERLHLLDLHDEAQELDPQPRKLGVMWDIW